ncbi:MAG: redoxin domain-containing protein, partial [Desulfobulbaceae bacterium]|nr:redoxin domain-containing protein [Desulfobulbaceae bacterium]
MKGKLKSAVRYAVVLVAVWTFLGGSAFAQAVGSDAPDFSAVDTQGQKVSLSGLKGKVVLLDF